MIKLLINKLFEIVKILDIIFIYINIILDHLDF